MVGVPRSKGCLTCRRRKIACDQEKPECRACQRHGVRCEGYARYPVILQWTAEGLKKRERFEESKSPTSSGSSAALRRASGELSASTSQKSLTLSRQPAVGTFLLGQIQVQCLESYLPNSGSVVQELKTSWMWMTVTATELGTSLSASFAALCLAKMGLIQNEEALISQARSQYVIGLNTLQDALHNPALAFQDKTLAAIRTLSIYEMFALPFTSMTAAKSHEKGMTQWCAAAGPQSICTEFGLQVFEDVRWFIMNRNLEQHKCCILGSEDWTNLPWRTFPKDSLQQLFDTGFKLAALLEEVDACTDSQAPQLLSTSRDQLSVQCTLLRHDLDLWYSIHWADHAGLPPIVGIDGMGEVQGTPSDPTLGDFWEGTNLVNYWLFGLILNGIVLKVSGEGAREQKHAAQSLQLATSIVQASPRFLAEDTGWVGPQRLFFPVRQALEYLAKVQSPLAKDAQVALRGAVSRLQTYSSSPKLSTTGRMTPDACA